MISKLDLASSQFHQILQSVNSRISIILERLRSNSVKIKLRHLLSENKGPRVCSVNVRTIKNNGKKCYSPARGSRLWASGWISRCLSHSNSQSYSKRLQTRSWTWRTAFAFSVSALWLWSTNCFVVAAAVARMSAAVAAVAAAAFAAWSVEWVPIVASWGHRCWRQATWHSVKQRNEHKNISNNSQRQFCPPCWQNSSDTNLLINIDLNNQKETKFDTTFQLSRGLEDTNK